MAVCGSVHLASVAEYETDQKIVCEGGIITHSLYLMSIGPMMRSQHPPHTNNSL